MPNKGQGFSNLFIHNNYMTFSLNSICFFFIYVWFQFLTDMMTTNVAVYGGHLTKVSKELVLKTVSSSSSSSSSSPVTHQAGAYPGLLSINRPEVFLLPNSLVFFVFACENAKVWSSILNSSYCTSILWYRTHSQPIRTRVILKLYYNYKYK